MLGRSLSRDPRTGRLVHRGALADPPHLPDKTATLTSVGGAPVGSAFVTIGNDATLTAERALAVAARLTLTDGGANSNVTLDLATVGAATGPIGGATTVPIVTIDAYGRVTALSSTTITGTVPGGAAGGDLSGTYPNPTIADADLIAIRDLAATAGMLSRTGAGAFAARTLTAPAAGLTISNPTGSGGNPTFALANDLAALEGLGSTGLAARTAADTWAQRTITSASTAALTVADGDGVAGNPTLTVDADLVEIAGVANVRGDLLVTNSGPTWVRLAIGAANRVLRSDGTDPSWAQVVLTTDVTGVLPIANGGTNLSALGAANTVLNVNNAGTALEYDKLVAANCGSTTGTGDVFVFQTAPTFVTSIITPIVYGSGSSTGGLTLRANDDDYLGTIGIDSTQLWWDDIPDYTAGSTETKRVARFNATLTAAPTGTNVHTLYGLALDPTLTLTSSGSFPTFSLPQFIGYSFTPTVTLNAHGVIKAVEGNGTYTNTAAPSIATFQLFAGGPTLQSQTANVQPYDPTIFISAPTMRYDVNSGTATSSAGHRGYVDQPTVVNVQAGGTFNVPVTGFLSALTMTQTAGTLTVPTRTGYKFNDATGTGTLTTQVAVDIAALSYGTTNIGIRNASRTVWTPTVVAISGGSAAATTISHAGTSIRLNNTTGGLVTLTSTPTLTDGQDGQIVTIFNGSAQSVALQDETALAGSNLRLAGAATLTLGQRDSVTLLFSSTLGDWIQIGASNN